LKGDELFDDGRGIELFDGYYHVTLIYAKLKPFRPTRFFSFSYL